MSTANHTMYFSSPASLMSFLVTIASTLGIDVNTQALIGILLPAEFAHPGLKTAVDAIIANIDTVFPDLNSLVKPYLVSLLSAISVHLPA